jgi:hypothetical protein
MSNYKRSGQFELVRLVITTKGNQPVELDLSSSYTDVTVYESIIDKTMSGTVSFVDSTNIVNEYGLGNGETVEVEWYTVGMENADIKYTGVVYDVTGPAAINDHSAGYTLHFMSRETFKSMGIRLYSGHEENVDSIVKKVFDKVKAEKQLETKPCKYIENIVFTGDRVYDAINQCINLAVSNHGEYGYVFFENNQKFQFVPLAELYRQEPVISYTYQSQPVYDNPKNAAEESFTVLQDYEVEDSNKFLDEIADGLHGATSCHISLKHKEVEVYKDSIEKTFKESNSLGKFPMRSKTEPNFNYVISVGANVLPRQSEIDLYKNTLVKMAMNTFTVVAGIHGNSQLKVGDVCNLSLPSYSSNDFTQNHVDFISGKFLLVEIKHILTAKGYNQRVLFMKDAFEETVA